MRALNGTSPLSYDIEGNPLGTPMFVPFSEPSYRSLGKQQTQETNFLAIAGPHSVLYRDKGVHPSEIPDGAPDTVVAIEAFNTGIKWFEPKDVAIEDLDTWLSEYQPRYHYAGLLFADGKYFWMKRKPSIKTLRALCTMDGNEKVLRERLVANGTLIAR